MMVPLVVSAGHAGGCCQPGDEGGVGVAHVNSSIINRVNVELTMCCHNTFSTQH